MSAPPNEDPWVLDPRLEDLPFPRLIVERAAAGGATTLRQLARIPPSKLLSPDSIALAQARAILERYLGRTWEELAAVVPSPGNPPRRLDGPRAPTCWDELRLVLPIALRSVRLVQIDLPDRMRTHSAKHGYETLEDLARVSEAELLETPRLGRLTVHRTFVAVTDFAERAGWIATMPPPVSLEEVDADPALLDAWKVYLDALPPDPRRAMRLHAGLDGRRPETYGAIGALLGVSPAAARRLDAQAVDILTANKPWMTSVRARFARALRTPRVPLASLAKDRWWSGIVAVPHALDYFGERVLGGEACVLDLDGQAYLARSDKA